MKIAKIVAILGIIAMTSVLVYGFTIGNFQLDGAEIVNNPWGIVSLVDLYTGFILFSGWIIFREKSFFSSLVWIILMMTLGFFTASLYVLIALIKADNNWQKFWMGNRLNE